VAKKIKVPTKLARTLAAAGTISTREARCSDPGDQERIRDEVENHLSDGNKKGFDMLDSAVRQLTMKARREATRHILYSAWPIGVCFVCYIRVAKKGRSDWLRTVAPHEWVTKWTLNRIAYDPLCDHGFIEEEKGCWSWGLLIGVVIGYTATIFLVLRTAKGKYGSTSRWDWLKCVLFLVIVDLILFALTTAADKTGGICGYAASLSPRENWVAGFNWFIIGLASSIWQGEFCILLLLLGAITVHSRVKRFKTFSKKNGYIRLLLLVLAVITTAVLIWLSDPFAKDPRRGLYPSVVVNVCAMIGLFFGPFAAMWRAAERWGLKVDSKEL
jgi:hypothetical protein